MLRTGASKIYYNYITQQTFGIPLVEVKNASQAFAYATGLIAPHPLTYNTYTNYYVDKIPYTNLSCLYCNLSSFQNSQALHLIL